MIKKQLRKVMLANMALWGFAILLPIIAPAFTSKQPKIFDILIPMLQLILARGSTQMFAGLLEFAKNAPQNDDETK